MGWGDSKRDLIIAELAAAKREIELLREQIVDLRKDRDNLIQQLKWSQDALVAKESPEAYRDMMYSRDSVNQIEMTPEEKIARKQKEEQVSLIAAYINEIENPLFKDADDMIQLLTRATGVPLAETSSLHGNDES